MIIDKIENLTLYSQIPLEAVKLLQNLSSGTETGRYELNDGNYVNIETYNTKPLSDAKFESHRKFIDIQLLLSGKERIYVKPLKELSALAPYNAQKDIIFYSDNVEAADYITLDSTNFVMLFPHEAHAPQAACSGAVSVKKVVAKIRV